MMFCPRPRLLTTPIKASKDTNVSYALKHFPGYGSNLDTHNGISRDKRSYKELLKKHNNILLGLQKRIESDENTIKRTIVSQKIISELNRILTTGDVKYE